MNSRLLRVARAAFWFAGWLGIGGLAVADTYPRQTGFKIINYTFDITVGDTNNEFAVQETVEAQALRAGATNLDLDLCNFKQQPRNPRLDNGAPDPCAEPSGGRGNPAPPSGSKGMTVTAITSGGQSLKFEHANDRLRVNLPRAYQSGEHIEFIISYHGTPATGILIGNNKYGDRGFFSNPWPHKARNYLAVVDHPSMKSPVVHIITAPRRYQAVSNGLLTEETDLPNDLRRTTWKESSPICPCLMAVGIAPFAVEHFGEYRGIPFSSWIFPQDREVSFKRLRAFTQPIMEFFINRIGPYSYEKVAHVEANGIGGGMELASAIFYGFNDGPNRQVVAHEIAHQWFGDSAAEKDWDDVWLSEGFATYFALLYQEYQDGHDAFLEGVKRSKEQAIRYALANPESTIVHKNLADFSKVIANNAQIYQGGAQVLQNVRGVIGTENFWAGIRLYYSRFQNSNANTDDLRTAMQDACRAAGDGCPTDGKDLTWLFQELLNRGGVLQVEGTWHYDAAAKQVQVSLDQKQTSGLYRMPIELGITLMETPPAGGRGGRGGAAGAVAAAPEPPRPQPVQHVHLMQLKEQRQTFTFPVASEPVSVTLDPNAWTMMQATWQKN